MISKEEREARSQRMKDMHAAKKADKAANEIEIGELAAEATGTRERGARPGRNLFNGQQMRLAVMGEIPGYHLHWFNDEPGRIEMALASGYEFVTHDEVQLTASRRVTDTNADLGSRITTVVTNDKDANFQKAVLMKIREEWFLADQKEQQEAITERENQMIRTGGAANVPNKYVPKTHADGNALRITHRNR